MSCHDVFSRRKSGWHGAEWLEEMRDKKDQRVRKVLRKQESKMQRLEAEMSKKKAREAGP